MSDCLFSAFIPAEIVVAVGEVYVGFVEDGCPLEWRSVNNLTSGTMTKLGIKRPLPRKLILHPPTVTTPFIECVEPLSIFTMNFIRCVEFPLVVFAFDILCIMPV